MFEFELEAARKRLDDAIHFKRGGGGYWYPDLLADRHALSLIKIQLKPSKDEDEILRQLNGLAAACFVQ